MAKGNLVLNEEGCFSVEKINRDLDEILEKMSSRSSHTLMDLNQLCQQEEPEYEEEAEMSELDFNTDQPVNVFLNRDTFGAEVYVSNKSSILPSARFN